MKGAGAGFLAADAADVPGGQDPTEAIALITSTCTGENQTVIDGECADDFVDSSKLPDYSEDLVRPGAPEGACFPTGRCFVDARKVEVDLAACTATVRGDVAKLNLALVTPDTGECLGEGRCLVPLDRGLSGWTVKGGAKPEGGAVVALAKGLCRKVSGGTQLVEAYSDLSSCAPKGEANPVCQETGASSVAEAGADTSTPGAQRIVALDGPIAVALAEIAAGAARLVVIGPRGVFSYAVPAGDDAVDHQLASIAVGGVSATAGRVVVTDRATGRAWYATALPNFTPRFPLGDAGGVLNAGTYVYPSLIWATGGSNGLLRYEDAENPQVSYIVPGDFTAVAPLAGYLGEGVLAGTATGKLFYCALGECGFPVILPGAVQSVAVYRTIGAAMAGEDVVILTEPNLTSKLPRQSITVAAGSPPHGMAIVPASGDKACLYFTDNDGKVQWVLVDFAGKLSTVEVLQAGPRPALGLAADGQFVYWTVGAAASAGGGIYRAPVPDLCRVPVGDAGGGGLDAGAGSVDGGLVDASVDAGVFVANLVKDGLETDVDCGGPVAPKCGSGKACLLPTDCVSLDCVATICM